MVEKEPKIPGEKKKDLFWLIVVLGVVAVIGGAILTGNILAKVFLKGDKGTPTIATKPGDENYVPPDFEEPQPMPSPDDSATDDYGARNRNQAKTGKISSATDSATLGATSTTATNSANGGSSITIDVEKTDANRDDGSGNAPDKKQDVEDNSADTGGTGSPRSDRDAPQKKPAESREPAATREQPANPAPEIIYVLQLGVYSDRVNAEKMKVSIDQETGLKAYIAEVQSEGVTKYRVQVGAFHDRVNADKLSRELQIKGYRSYTAPMQASSKNN